MPSIDLVVLASILLSSLTGGVLLWRRGIRGRHYALTMTTLFYGVVLVATMSAHCVDVLGRLHAGRGYDGAGFTYDFRAYSLLLLGVLLIGQGVALCRVAVVLARESLPSGKEAVRRLVVVLGMVAPLIPIHSFFAIPLTALAAITLGAWLGIGRSVIRPHAAARRERIWTPVTAAY